MSIEKKNKSEILHTELRDILMDLGINGEPVINENIVKEGKDQDYIDNLIINANTRFKELYEQSIKDSFYWQYCPLKVYEETFNTRYKEFQSKYLDSNKEDFINNELEFINSYSDLYLKIEFHDKPDKFGYKSELKFDIPLPVYLHPDIVENIEITQKRKIEFLNNIEAEKETIEDKPIFKDELLTEFHKVFNKSGELWEEIELIPFIESWQGKGNRIKINKNCISYFCYAVGCIEGNRNMDLYPNMNDFMQKTFEINDYKGRKRINPKDSESSTSKKKYDIKRKIDTIIKQFEL